MAHQTTPHTESQQNRNPTKPTLSRINSHKTPAADRTPSFIAMPTERKPAATAPRRTIRELPNT